MSSIGATAGWGPAVRQAESEVRLTRRGRLLRTIAVLVVVLAASLALMGRMAGEPVRAESGPVAESVVTTSVVVEQGDSLWLIAQRLAPQRDPRDLVYEIRELNGLRSNLLQPGQVLLVPTRAQG